MSFVESIRTVMSKYADFNGRARRSEFWWYYLAYIVVISVLYFLVIIPTAVMSASDPTGSEELPAFAVVAMLLLFAVAVGFLLPTIAVVVRRLHDTDRSGFFYFMGFIPFVGGIILLVFLAGSGTPGPNRFGPDPKAAPLPVQA
ncbi:DUF805 domain-containing protein [Myceligenerans halotolerans]